MRFFEFEKVLSPARINRYLSACYGNTKKAMTLYRYNLRLSQDMFTVISCYEVALRNSIDSVLTKSIGPDWLRDSILPGGFFTNPKFNTTAKIIRNAYFGLMRNRAYSHDKLLAEMEFGVWKHLFSTPHYRATGQVLLTVFPRKPKSSASFHYDNSFLFNELDSINRLRNRIAHHEPICFSRNNDTISTTHLLNVYHRIMKLFSWMNLDGGAILFGLDHIYKINSRIMALA